MSDRTVVIFGSSATRPGEILYSEAEELGRLVALGGYRVYNGGYDGIMEASAKGAREMGGRTVGITTHTLKAYKRNPWIDENHWIVTGSPSGSLTDAAKLMATPKRSVAGS